MGCRSRMRALAWACLGVAALAAAQAALGLADPGVPRSDLPTFASASLAILFAFLALAVSRVERWWHWWFPAFWLGCGVAVAFLAYKETLAEELAHFGPARFAWQLFLHVLIGPIELFFAFFVGFADPRGPLYVLASLAFAFLAAELLRRRLWPRREGSGVSAGSSAGP